MYNYLNFFSEHSVREISIKYESFLKDLLKGFKLKSVYITKGENNIEKVYNNFVFNNKKIDDVFYKNVINELSDKNKNILQEIILKHLKMKLANYYILCTDHKAYKTTI